MRDRITGFLMALLTAIAVECKARWDRWVHVPLLLAFADVTDTFYAGEAFIGYSGQLKVGQGDSPQTFVAVADVTMIEPGNTPATIINKTHLRSPGRTHEKISTIRDLGPFKLAGNYRPGHGSHALAGGDGFAAPSYGGASDGKSLPALHRSQAVNDFQIELTDADSVVHILGPFAGVVSDYKIGQITLENKVEFTADIQPLSDWTASLP